MTVHVKATGIWLRIQLTMNSVRYNSMRPTTRVMIFSHTIWTSSANCLLVMTPTRGSVPNKMVRRFPSMVKNWLGQFQFPKGGWCLASVLLKILNHVGWFVKSELVCDNFGRLGGTLEQTLDFQYSTLVNYRLWREFKFFLGQFG